MTFDHAALFGEDYVEPNVYAVHGLASGRVWCAISLGGRSVLVRKTGEPVPNEDALLAAEHGERVLLAVADGHFGHAASHDLIERLHLALERRAEALAQMKGANADPLPRDLDGLRDLITACADPAPPAVVLPTPAEPSAPDDPPSPTATLTSETTLVVAILDRRASKVWGVSAGDSSAVLLGLDAGARWLTAPTRTYLAPSQPESLSKERLAGFESPVAAGELVALFTDGVNECHYGSPETSIGARHMESLLIRSAGGPQRFAESLAELALAGVDGNPGGQDNLALVVART